MPSPVRRIFPPGSSFQRSFLWYLRVNARDKRKSGSCRAVVSCNCGYLVGLFGGGVDGGDIS